MTAFASAPSEDRWRGRFLLWAIMAVAAALRLWRLETPSLWFDEALVAMVAKLPCGSIFTRALTEDFHPPGFYLLAKTAMLMGTSNAALRIPELVFGLAGVWFAWKAGREMLSESGGLALAALAAVQPWHILLSRQLRPYSIIFLFSLASLYFLWRALRDGKARDFILAGLSLWPPLLLHFSGMLAAGGAGVAVLGALLVRRVKPGNFILFCIACGLGMALTLPFLSSMFGRESIAGSITRLEALATILKKLNELMFRSAHPGLQTGLSCLAALGFGSLFARSRLLALVSLGWVLPPLMVLAGVRYGSYFNAWHLMFLLPPALLWQAQAARALLGDRLLAWAALALAAAGAWWHLGPDSPRLYEPASYSGNYSGQAREIAGSHTPGTAYVYPESAVSGPLNWYLDQFTDPNPLRAQRLGPEDARARIVVPGTSSPARTISRQPVQAMGPPPFRARITCAPDDFLARVNSLDHVACQPVLENILIATQAGRTGHAEFVFENASETPQDVTVHFGFANGKPGNRFAAMVRFDGEPWAASFESIGPDPRGHDKLTVMRERPYRRLTVRFELFRDGRSAAFTGDDLEAVRFLDFKVEAVPGKIF